MSHDSEVSRRRLARENAALAEIGLVIGSSLDIDEVYARFAEEVRELLPFDRLSIATVDLEAGTLTYAYVAGVAIRGWGPGEVLPLADSVNESSVACGNGHLLELDPQRLGQRAFDAQRLALGAGLRSGITLPLLSRGVVVGTLNLRSKQADAYTEQDLRLAERVAAQIAGAMANSELHLSVQRDAKERAILAEIGRTISSTLDIDEVYSGFAERVGELIQFDRLNINLLVSEDEVFTTAHVTGVEIPGRRAGEVTRLTGTFMRAVVQEKAGLIFHPEDRGRMKALYPSLRSGFDAGFRSFLGVPLVSGDRVIGTIHFQSTETNTYSALDLRLAEQVGAQIAGAIELYERIEQEVAERTELQTQQLHSQKLETVGQLAGGLAHDFNNILNVIMGYCDLTAGEMSPEDKTSLYLGEIQKAADRAAHLTHQLLGLSRRQMIEPRVVSLNELILDTDRLLRRVIGEDIELVTLPTANLGMVKMDPGQIEQVLMNLAVNARDAMPSGGKLLIQTANVTLDHDYARRNPDASSGEHIVISVSDTGTGMTPEVMSRAFEPFFTTKEVGKGTGLGLFMCYGIVVQSGGHMTLQSEPGSGTTFNIYLPCVDEEADGLPLADSVGHLPLGSETVLLVEDEPTVRGVEAHLLGEQGYKVLQAANGVEALRVACDLHEEIHLLVTDVVMPLMGGEELTRELAQIHPETKVLHTSGYPGDVIVRHGISASRADFLQKPFTPGVFVRKVREVLDG